MPGDFEKAVEELRKLEEVAEKKRREVVEAHAKALGTSAEKTISRNEERDERSRASLSRALGGNVQGFVRDPEGNVATVTLDDSEQVKGGDILGRSVGQGLARAVLGNPAGQGIASRVSRFAHKPGDVLTDERQRLIDMERDKFFEELRREEGSFRGGLDKGISEKERALLLALGQ